MALLAAIPRLILTLHLGAVLVRVGLRERKDLEAAAIGDQAALMSHPFV